MSRLSNSTDVTAQFMHDVGEFGRVGDLQIAGPGQMGTEDQGVFTHWAARHLYGGGALEYRGWGGNGKQVRDLLHVDDAWALLRAQMERWDAVKGTTVNAGGGAAVSLSLQEATALCAELTGTRVSVGSRPATDPSDVRLYVTDNAAVTRATGWAPTRDARAIVGDTLAWLDADRARLAPVFAPRQG